MAQNRLNLMQSYKCRKYETIAEPEPQKMEREVFDIENREPAWAPCFFSSAIASRDERRGRDISSLNFVPRRGRSSSLGGGPIY